MSDYKPIDCDLYSRYELAIMRRQPLRVAWRDDDGESHLEALLPVNLRTRKRVEYLLAKTRFSKILEIRLDHIIRSEPWSATP